MTEQTSEPGKRRDHGCQTPGCPNDYSVVIVRTDDGKTDFFCEGCNLVFWLAVFRQLGEQGTLPEFEEAAAAATP